MLELVESLSWEDLASGSVSTGDTRLVISIESNVTTTPFVNADERTDSAYAVLVWDNLYFIRAVGDHSSGNGTITDIKATFELNGGSGARMQQTFNANSAFNVPDCTSVAPPDKTFIGWSTEPDGSGKFVETYGAVMLGADTVLYAVYA